MKVVLQRVSRARVEVDSQTVGQIADGLLVLLGITHADTEQDADTLVEKITKLRIFEDGDGAMNDSILDTAGGLLVVSQFTLYADCKKGNRPSFGDASRPEHAEPLYNYFIQKCIDTGLHVETGEFGAHMQVDLVNDGPVTIVLEM
jgi:D-tyrosyl-tRNA(Tyr) deacylase